MSDSEKFVSYARPLPADIQVACSMIVDRLLPLYRPPGALADDTAYGLTQARNTAREITYHLLRAARPDLFVDAPPPPEPTPAPPGLDPLTVIWLDNGVQFTRLLATIAGNGVSTGDLTAFGRSMDLSLKEVMTLFHRAIAAWEQYKAGHGLTRFAPPDAAATPREPVTGSLLDLVEGIADGFRCPDRAPEQIGPVFLLGNDLGRVLATACQVREKYIVDRDDIPSLEEARKARDKNCLDDDD